MTIKLRDPLLVLWLRLFLAGFNRFVAYSFRSKTKRKMWCAEDEQKKSVAKISCRRCFARLFLRVLGVCISHISAHTHAYTHTHSHRKINRLPWQLIRHSLNLGYREGAHATYTHKIADSPESNAKYFIIKYYF